MRRPTWRLPIFCIGEVSPPRREAEVFTRWSPLDRRSVVPRRDVAGHISTVDRASMPSPLAMAPWWLSWHRTCRGAVRAVNRSVRTRCGVPSRVSPTLLRQYEKSRGQRDADEADQDGEHRKPSIHMSVEIVEPLVHVRALLIKQHRELLTLLLKAFVDLIETPVHLLKALVDLVEPFFDLLEPSIHLIEAFFDLFKALVDLLESFFDLFKALVDLLEPFVNLLEPFFDLLELFLNLIEPALDEFVLRFDRLLNPDGSFAELPTPARGESPPARWQGACERSSRSFPAFDP